jgi:hypothetical protein
LQHKLSIFLSEIEMKIAVYFIVLITSGLTLSHKHKDIAVSKVRNSLPEQILGCMQKFNLLRCLKYFLLLRLESSQKSPTLDKITSTNFFEVILKNMDTISTDDFPKKYHKLDEEQLNTMLTEKIQSFFKNQPITLRFIPNIPVKIVPINTKSGEIEISIKRDKNANFLSRKLKNESDDDDNSSSEENESGDSAVNKDDGSATDKQAMRRKGNYLQVGVPLLLTPVMLFFGILPFLIPVLKFATAITSVINLAALVGSIIFLGKRTFNSYSPSQCNLHKNIFLNQLNRSSTFNRKGNATNNLLQSRL